MKKTKPDRFNKLVKARMEKDGGLWSDNVVDLLRKEYRAVVRMVLREFKVWATTSPDGYASAPASRHERAKQCRDILDKLKKRAT
ncbi:MAG: hypothetical protein WA045_14220 [Nitrospira sp.]